MKFNIQNFRGIKAAEIEPKNITLIAGKNHAGKTSTIQAISAILSGQTIPIDGIKKTEIGMLIHSGSASGQVNISSGEYSSSIKYPQGTRDISGEPVIEISREAAGISSIIDMTPKERSKFLGELLKASPDKNDLSAELKKNGINDGYLNKIWESIEANGWDSAHKQATEKGSKLKGAWQQITKTDYGIRKAESWLPAEYEPLIDLETEDSLSEKVKKEETWLETAIASNAVDASKIADIESEIKLIGDVGGKLDTLNAQIKILVADETTINSTLEKLPELKNDSTVSCPHCKKPVQISGKNLLIPKVISEKEIKERSESIEKTKKSLLILQTEIEKLRSESRELENSARRRDTLLKNLNELKSKPAGEDTTKKIEECRTNLKRAENLLNAFKAKREADKHAGNIINNKKICDIMSSDGVRLDKLNKVLKSFNSVAQGFCILAKWRPVEISSDMQISFGGSPFALLSKSEQFRVSVILQTTIAQFDNSEILLFDGVDILDSDGRNGFIKMLLSTDKKSIVGMTISKREDVPKIESVGGVAYWIEENATEKI